MRAQGLGRVETACQFRLCQGCVNFLVTDMMQQNGRPVLATFQPWHQMVQRLRHMRRNRAQAKGANGVLGHSAKDGVPWPSVNPSVQMQPHRRAIKPAPDQKICIRNFGKLLLPVAKTVIGDYGHPALACFVQNQRISRCALWGNAHRPRGQADFPSQVLWLHIAVFHQIPRVCVKPHKRGITLVVQGGHHRFDSL